MKKDKKIKTTAKIYWFFRSFAISATVIFCLLFLIIGSSVCYARMESTVTGEKIALIERREDKIYILGKEFCSADFLLVKVL